MNPNMQAKKYGTTNEPNNRASYAKNVIAVTSGKGGVGKSTVSTNLAVALAKQGFKVGLLDADIYGPDIPRMMGLNDAKLRWGDVKMLPSENFGVKIMSVGMTTPSDDTPLVWRSSVAVSALVQFLDETDWGELDFLVIDMPPGTGDIQLTVAQELKLSGAILVTTPQLISTGDVSRAIMMYKEIGVNIIGIVENMSYYIDDKNEPVYIFGKGGGEALAQKYGVELLAQIPLMQSIRELSDDGKPPVLNASDDIKKYYWELAKKISK